MSNLKLVSDDPTPLEKLLLDASRAEQPSEDHRSRLRVMLGLAVPISGPLAASPSALAPPQAAVAASPPTAASATKSAALGKVALGVGVAVLVGAFAFMRQPNSAPVPVTKPVVAVAVASPVAVPPVREAALAASPLPPVKAPASTAQVARADTSASATADLSEQIRLIEAARAGVAARDGKAASAALDAYSAKFPRGSFGQEAMVLRIRAVDQAGDSSRATALAKAFITRFPSSPHVARLKPIAERGASR